jgi:Tol biopolymer transport system component
VSPDGRQLVFHMLGDIYRVGIDGGEAEALTDGIEWNFQPRFSPDGRRIAFVSDRDGAENIWIMDADGGNPAQVTKERDHLLHNPAWSPDGDYIAARKGFVSRRSIPAGSIWLYHRGGGGGIELVERLHGAQSQKNIAEPDFSPDGRHVYFSQDMTAGQVWEYNKDANQGIFAVRRLDRETGQVETIVSGPGGAIRPVVSPDGRTLAFVRRNAETLSSRLMVKDLVSGIERTLYDGLDRDKQETSGDMGNYPHYSWLPDGSGLVFWAGGGFHRVGLDGSHRPIEVRVRAEKKVHPALQRTVQVDADEFEVKMLRWSQLSPDGRTAIYQALGHIWVHDVASGERRRLTRQSDHWEFHPAFSPDGRQVVYTTFDDEALGTVRIAPLGRGQARVLTTEPGHYVEPAFSPDGQRVAFRKITAATSPRRTGRRSRGCTSSTATGATCAACWTRAPGRSSPRTASGCCTPAATTRATSRSSAPISRDGMSASTLPASGSPSTGCRPTAAGWRSPSTSTPMSRRSSPPASRSPLAAMPRPSRCARCPRAAARCCTGQPTARRCAGPTGPRSSSAASATPLHSSPTPPSPCRSR